MKIENIAGCRGKGTPRSANKKAGERTRRRGASREENLDGGLAGAIET